MTSSFVVELPRSDACEMDAILSSSWPSAAKSSLRHQPPRAPLRAPSPVSWEVPPLTLSKSPRQGFCCSSSDTTVGEGFVGGSFTSSCDFSDDDGEPCMFSLEEYTREDVIHEEGASWFDMCMVGFYDSVETTADDVASNDPSANEIALGASPLLLSVLAEVHARATPPKALLQPPKAPLLKPSLPPLEVPFFELPVSVGSFPDSLLLD